VARGNSAGSQTTKATLGLRELILAGEIGPGERVGELELSERLGVSRTPLRIALTTLAHEGLLEPLAGGGFVVRAFTRDDIADGIELRGVLEGLAARLAAERLDSEDELAPLESAYEELDDVVRNLDRVALIRYVALNRTFHESLAELAKSPHVARAVANASALPFATPSAILLSHAVLPGSQEILLVAQYQHRALIDAVRAGHGARAEEVAREHARLSLSNLELALANRDALETIPGAPLLAEPVPIGETPS
jgi:GntR family transcriptional regulator, vanillate catabolism transcriptional regulator